MVSKFVRLKARHLGGVLLILGLMATIFVSAALAASNYFGPAYISGAGTFHSGSSRYLTGNGMSSVPNNSAKRVYVDVAGYPNSGASADGFVIASYSPAITGVPRCEVPIPFLAAWNYRCDSQP